MIFGVEDRRSRRFSQQRIVNLYEQGKEGDEKSCLETWCSLSQGDMSVGRRKG